MIIPYVNLSKQYQLERKKLIKVIDKVLLKGVYIGGDQVDLFEKKIAKFCNTKYCVALNSGTDSLVLALHSLGVRRGDEVITTPNSFIASTAVIIHLGAKPVFVDVKSDQNIDPSEIEKKITKKTKVIMAVHLTGRMCEMDKIMSIANAHNLLVIEDNAQSQGATFKGKMTGSFGHINATSFYPGKNLGAYGDAGAITSDNYNLIELSKVIRNYGSRVKYFNEIKGFNSRLDELQACLLSIKLKQLDEMNSLRNRVAQKYNEVLQNTGDLILPFEVDESKAVYHLYVVRTERRDELQKKLNVGMPGLKIDGERPVPLSAPVVN
jgi:dTDP-4-amino-4,6-dideoxygalactose transaminase